MTTTPTAEELRAFKEVLGGYAFFQALAAACELDLFTLLARSDGLTAEEIRAHLAADPQAIRIILLGCATVDLVRRSEDGKYRNSPAAGHFLSADSSNNLLAFVRLNRLQYRGCALFPEAVAERRNVGVEVVAGPGRTLYERLAHDPKLEADYHAGMANFTWVSQTAFWEHPAFSRIERLLDLCGSTGTNSIELCRRHPGLKAVVYDLPSVVEGARARIAREGLSERIGVAGGNVFADPVPTGCDAVLISHMLEIFSEEKILATIGRAHKALPRDGRLLLWALTARDDETGDVQAAKGSIYFYAMASGEGMAYPAKDYVRWLSQTGFVDIERHPFPEFEHTLLIGRKV